LRIPRLGSFNERGGVDTAASSLTRRFTIVERHRNPQRSQARRQGTFPFGSDDSDVTILKAANAEVDFQANLTSGVVWEANPCAD
jgi:hypothetical protein